MKMFLDLFYQGLENI